MIDWPESLVEHLALRRAVIFLGAGVSRNATGVNGERPPLWETFLRKALDRCTGSKKHIKQVLSKGDLLTACELIKNRLDEDWPRTLNDVFVVPRFSPADIHRHIYRIDTRLILTPNFDKIYDGLASKESEQTVTIKTYYDQDVFTICRDKSRAILKVHGTIDSPSKMIFTRNDYAKARVEHAIFYNMLDALVTTNTFFFIGAGLNDPDIQLILERQAFSYPHSPPHYIVMPRPLHDDLCNTVRNNLNLKVILYSSNNNHAELTESLASLAELVENRRESIAKSANW